MLFKPRTTKGADKAALNKVAAPIINRPVMKVRGGAGGLADTIAAANTLVEAQLGKFRDNYLLIRDEEALKGYFAQIKQVKKFALDTETSGLDPISDSLAGVCLYVPGGKAAYIPLGHISYITGMPAKNQIPLDLMAKYLQEVSGDDYFIVMHNGKFDIRFIKNQLGVKMHCDWDTMIAACLLDENEQHHLKGLHSKYCNNGKDDYKFDSLFKGVSFPLIPIKTAYLYAARDPLITWELYEFQKQYLNPENEELASCYDAFIHNEMPLLPIMADTEDFGIALDMGTQQRLKAKYEAKLSEIEAKISDIMKPLESKIADYRTKQLKSGQKGVKLDEPINLTSPAQVAVLLYDIMGLKNPSKKEERGTGEKILEKLKDPSGLVECILELRGIKKLLSTYIDKMPEVRNKKTGKIHCHFNQYGTVTGRMSSNEPNMQNIPARGESSEIRTMFVADPGYVLISCDYSQQEPRILAHVSGDEHLISAYKEGKDLYAQMSSLVFHRSYEDCLEHFPDGSLNKEGKRLRGMMKAIVLGIMYSKEAPSIAEDLKISIDEAKNLYDTFFKRFPKVKQYLDNTQAFARKNGYVKTIWGRKRRLPDMMLNPYEIEYLDGGTKSVDFDPLDFSSGQQEVKKVPAVEKNRIIKELKSARGASARIFIEKRWAEKGYKVQDNTYKILDATRQCVNSVIQGSAADMTKKASIICYNDPRLKKLGARICLWVHDETITQVPEEHAKEACALISENMKKAADILCVPMKCDCEVMKSWSGPTIAI